MPYFKNDSVNLLHIHIPKTGGSSIERYFSDKYQIPLNTSSLYSFLDSNVKINNNIVINSSLQHITYGTICKYQKFFGIDFNNITILTVVRNPYERLVSDLFFLNKITISDTPSRVFEILVDYLKADDLDNHNLPQYSYIINDKRELIPNIKILYTETLNKDMADLGYSDFSYRENANSHMLIYYDYLNTDSINLINTFYNYDFILFGYKKIVN